MSEDATGLLYPLFAALLEYPTPAIYQQSSLCRELFSAAPLDTANPLEHFCQSLEKRTLEQMQELYTITFDMQPVCYPYIGYQLFGESYKRGAFMAQLNEAYHLSGYSAGQELPDHVSVILRFLGVDPARREGDFGEALLCEGLEPGLKKMMDALGMQPHNPYADVITALLSVLTITHEKEVDHA